MATINLGAIKFNWKGVYNNGTTYAVDDVVSSGGNSYVCIQASTGNAVGNATAYWNIMSSAGTNGSNGTDLSSTLSTRGDLVFKNASALARLAKGTAGQVLGQGSNEPLWINGSSSTLTTQGDILYRDGSGLQRLAKGTTGEILKQSSSNAPEWGTAPSGKVKQVITASNTSSTTSSSYNTNVSSIANNAGVAHVTISITPQSSASQFIISASAPAGVSGNGSCYAGIFVSGVCRAVTIGNGYANDAGGLTVTGYYNNTNLNAKTIDFRSLGGYNGVTTTLGNRRGSGGGSGDHIQADGQYGNLTVMEVTN